MLTYNLFIAVVAFLLALDYYVHKYDVHLQHGGTRLSFGNTFMYLALGVIIFFAGFRYEIGYDYNKYLAGYLYDSELRVWEPLFVFFVRLLRNVNFGLDIQGMFLFFSGLTIVVLYHALRKLTPHYRLGILLYLLVPSLYLSSFSVIRQGIALVILLYGLHYIAKEKAEYPKYMLVSVVAFLFHYSAAFVTLVYMVAGKLFQRNYSWIFYTFLIVVSFFLSFAHIGKMLLLYAPGHFSSYANNYGYSVSVLKLLAVNGFFLFLMFQKNHFLKTKRDIYLLNSLFFGLLIFNIFSDFAFVSRLAQYFMAAEIVLVPIYLYSIQDSFRRRVLLGLFMVYYLLNFNYALYRDELYNVKHDTHTLIPYKNYFTQEHRSYRNINLEAWYNYIQESAMNASEETDIK